MIGCIKRNNFSQKKCDIRSFQLSIHEYQINMYAYYFNNNSLALQIC